MRLQDSYILVKGHISVISDRTTLIAFKNCAPLIKRITKIDAITADDVENLELTVVVYNLLVTIIVT